MTDKKNVDASQKTETAAYVPTYKVKPEFKNAVKRAIGKYPFNQIHGIMNAISGEVIDHQALTQVINVLGNFPYQDVHVLLASINDFVEQVTED